MTNSLSRALYCHLSFLHILEYFPMEYYQATWLLCTSLNALALSPFKDFVVLLLIRFPIYIYIRKIYTDYTTIIIKCVESLKWANSR